MEGKNYIGDQQSAKGSEYIHSVNPVSGALLEGDFAVAVQEEVEEALTKAEQAWKVYRKKSGTERARFLRKIAEEIENLGDSLVHRVMQETALPEGRVRGERGRTCNQLRLFASYLEDGSWIEAVIDTADPDRAGIPKPDIRKYSVALGPVVVFTASNFPLAFSTAGGDTASALAAGCPVIVKAHESHPGTHALISQAIIRASRQSNMPDGVFSSLFGKGFEVGEALVQHRITKAVAFTGSFSGGAALYNLAAKRDEPIPVFAEMGSINPIFLTEESLAGNLEDLSLLLGSSVNLGAGQFCTNPGLIVYPKSENTAAFLKAMKTAFEQLTPATMLNKSIYDNYCALSQVKLVAEGHEVLVYKEDQGVKHEAMPMLVKVSAERFLSDYTCQEEVFGPFTMLVEAENERELIHIAEGLEGQLTASIMSQEDALVKYKALISILEEKVGRLIFNGVPTGVEVCHAMQHGGPYPATTDSRFTSVGTAAIMRFVRPIAYQDYPDALLPDALKNKNPLKIWRKLNGKLSQDSI